MRAFREANGFPGKSLDASPESEIFALNALGVSFAHRVRAVRQILAVALIPIGIIAFYAERFQQFPELSENLILSPAKCESYDFTGNMVNREPQPPLVALVANEAPHLVKLCFFRHKMRDYLYFYPLGVRVLV